MSKTVDPIPARYMGATPYLCVDGAAAALDFYRRVFGAEELTRLVGPDGRVMHAEMTIGAALVMLADTQPAMGFRSPLAIGGSPVSILVYVPDVDALTARAVAGGASVLLPVEDKFWGDRMVELRDPFGHLWSFATHVEDVGEAELERRFRALPGEPGDR